MSRLQIEADGVDGIASLTPADVEEISAEVKDTLSGVGISADSVTIQRDGVRVADADVSPPVGYLTDHAMGDWVELPDDHRSSTISTFRGGYAHREHPLEVLIWVLPPEVYGITPDGEVLLEHEIENEGELVELREGYLMGDEPTEKIAREIPYVVELLDTTDDGVLDSIRANDGKKTAHRVMAELEAGEYDNLGFGGDDA